MYEIKFKLFLKGEFVGYERHRIDSSVSVMIIEFGSICKGCDCSQITWEQYGNSYSGGEIIRHDEKRQFTNWTDKNGVDIYDGDDTNYGKIVWFNDLNWDSGGSRHPGFYFEDGCEHSDSKFDDHEMSYHTRFDEDIEVKA